MAHAPRHGFGSSSDRGPGYVMRMWFMRQQLVDRVSRHLSVYGDEYCCTVCCCRASVPAVLLWYGVWLIIHSGTYVRSTDDRL